MSDEVLIAQLRHPSTGAPTPVVDARAEFARMAASHPADPRKQGAFLAARRRRIEANTRRSPDEKAAWLARFDAANPSGGPTPDEFFGHIGFGFDYQFPFATEYTNGTAITYQVICPNTPGGNVQNHLYLTATNRAQLGLEVYVNYFGANNTADLSVYDWSLGKSDVNAGFVLSTFFPNLGRYFIGLGTHGQIFQTLFVYNATFEISNTKWTNQALLFNTVADTWDLIYSSTYRAVLTDQLSVGDLGSWGPIVESHEALNFVYQGTNPMGFFQSKVTATDGAGNPVNELLMDPSNTAQNGPRDGFQVSFLDANFDWAVFS